mgnify:CR=1 FL=1
MVKTNTTATYHPKDLVIVRTTDWDGNVKHEVGMITNVHYATQLTKKTYDIRTEAGPALIYTGVDEKKSVQTIVSNMTEVWLENGGTNNMWIHKRDGHTRANYSEDIKLIEDGAQKTDLDSNGNIIKVPTIMRVHQFEKYNDFKFPTQGPRSF